MRQICLGSSRPSCRAMSSEPLWLDWAFGLFQSNYSFIGVRLMAHVNKMKLKNRKKLMFYSNGQSETFSL